MKGQVLIPVILLFLFFGACKDTSKHTDKNLVRVDFPKNQVRDFSSPPPNDFLSICYHDGFIYFQGTLLYPLHLKKMPVKNPPLPEVKLIFHRIISPSILVPEINYFIYIGPRPLINEKYVNSFIDAQIKNELNTRKKIPVKISNVMVYDPVKILKNKQWHTSWIELKNSNIAFEHILNPFQKYLIHTVDLDKNPVQFFTTQDTTFHINGIKIGDSLNKIFKMLHLKPGSVPKSGTMNLILLNGNLNQLYMNHEVVLFDRKLQNHPYFLKAIILRVRDFRLSYITYINKIKRIENFYFYHDSSFMTLLQFNLP